ncbi:MAG: DNA-binding protein [Candidatus Hodarchaeota archaeon]
MDELERIKKRKLMELIKEAEKREREEEKQKEVDSKRNQILKTVCMPDAYDYLKSLRGAKPRTATEIERIIILLTTQRKLGGRVTKTGVMILERRIEGVGPKIRIKYRGEDLVDISEKLRKKK